MTASGPDPLDLQDERMVEELRELARVADPVPPEVVFAAKGSLAWRRVDAELAELSFDSSIDEDLLSSGVRGDDGVRMVSFEAPSLTVEVEITSSGDGRRLVGQLVPPQEAELELRSAGGSVAAATDELGRFSITTGAAGPASLRCRLGSGGSFVETGWVLL